MDFSETLKQLRSQYLINDVDFKNELIKLGCIDIVKQADPDYLVTLTFANAVNEFHAVKTLSMCVHHINKQVFGKRSKKKMTIFPFIERDASGEFHFHLVIKKPAIKKNCDLKKIIKKKWRSMRGHGFATFRKDKWFQTINTEGELDNVANYIVKQTYGDNNPLVVECLNY
jgi:hypothetical protein